MTREDYLANALCRFIIHLISHSVFISRSKHKFVLFSRSSFRLSTVLSRPDIHGTLMLCMALLFFHNLRDFNKRTSSLEDACPLLIQNFGRQISKCESFRPTVTRLLLFWDIIRLAEGRLENV